MEGCERRGVAEDSRRGGRASEGLRRGMEHHLHMHTSRRQTCCPPPSCLLLPAGDLASRSCAASPPRTRAHAALRLCANGGGGVRGGKRGGVRGGKRGGVRGGRHGGVRGGRHGGVRGGGVRGGLRGCVGRRRPENRLLGEVAFAMRGVNGGV